VDLLVGFLSGVGGVWIIFGGEDGRGSITGSLRLRRCNEETRGMGADTMEGIGGGTRSGMEGPRTEKMRVRYESRDQHVLAKSLETLIEAVVEPVEEEVVVAFVTRRTLGAGVGEGLRGRDTRDLRGLGVRSLSVGKGGTSMEDRGLAGRDRDCEDLRPRGIPKRL